MPKKENDKIASRREFYIHRISRNGKMYNEDDQLRNAKNIIVESQPNSIDNKNSNNDKINENNELIQDNIIENTQTKITTVEPPVKDENIGYYDEGVQYEESFDGIDDQIDQIYQESFIEPDEYIETIDIYTTTYQQMVNKPIERENIGNTNYEDKPTTKVDTKPIPVEKMAPLPVQTTKTNVVPVKPTKPTSYKKTKYIGPSLDLLTCSGKDNAEDETAALVQADIINKTFKESNIRAEVAQYIFGPTVTQFLIKIEEGVNVKDIRKVESNLLMYLQCESIRIQTPVPGKPFAGIEVPKKPENRRTVFLGDMLKNKKFKESPYYVPVAVGQDNYGNYMYIDLTEMPHGLVAGTTKSGKSVCLNAFLVSLIFKFSPDQLRLVLIDPKKIELGIFEGIPHLAMPVITEQEDLQSALGWVYDEMERRYAEFKVYDERDIIEYNKVREANKEPLMPFIIVIIDEFSDWFADASSEIESYMQKLAQKARAVGINIILAAQRPSKDVIKGSIKANFDTRIAFRVSSFDDAKVILGGSGAERLEGKGDMLIRYAGHVEQRLQGAFVPNSDIKKVIRFLRENNTTNYLVTAEEIHQSTVARQTKAVSGKSTGRSDERFEEIAYWVVRNKNASVNQITQLFGMGFNRVNDIILALESMKVISQGIKGKQREVLMDEFELTSLLESED